MKRSLLLSAVASIALCVSMITPTVRAQDVATPACLQETYDRLAAEQRQFRGVLLGEHAALSLPKGAVRFDRDGRAWRKTADDTWKTVAAMPVQARTDAAMEENREFPLRRGIFETRGILTSDLLPPILLSFQALQCRTAAVCMAAEASQRAQAADLVTIQPRGCIAFTFPRLRRCGGGSEGLTLAGTQIGTCRQARESLLTHEENALKMLVAYDASYRSLLRYAGTFDALLTAFHTPLLLPFWQMARVFDGFRALPCFNGQCD